MRIRKRTPARAASPGPGPSPPLPLTCQLLQPKELTAAEDREEEKQQLAKEEPVGGGEEDDLVVVVMAAASNSNSAAAADGGRCSRNDGKQWRCRSAAVPGHIFCDRHVAWSTRKRNRASKKTISQASPLQPPKTEPQTQQELDNDDKEEPATPAPAPANPRCGGGGIPPGSRKRGRSSGAGPA